MALHGAAGDPHALVPGAEPCTSGYTGQGSTVHARLTLMSTLWPPQVPVPSRVECLLLNMCDVRQSHRVMEM